jgi:ADP-heptose:LPS heptosyltransferase
MTKLLVIRFSSIGDLVLTTPVLRAIKQQAEGEVELHVLTKKQYAMVLDGNPHVKRIHIIDNTVQDVLPELINENFDYVIDLHSNIRSRVVKSKLRCPNFTFKKYNIEKWLWVNFGINRMPQKHIVERYLDTLQAFGVSPDEKGLEYYIPEKAKIQKIDLPEVMKSPFIAFAIGAAHEGKKMSRAHIIEVCRSIQHPLVLIGGTEDRELGSAIESECGNTVYNSCGQWTLHQSADAVSKAEIVIAGDTGMMHIASAFKKKIISLWGCTKPGLGMYPYLPDPSSIILEPLESVSFKPLSRPCSKLGNRCKHGMNNRCIDHITTAQVVDAIETLWAPQTTPSAQ